MRPPHRSRSSPSNFAIIIGQNAIAGAFLSTPSSRSSPTTPTTSRHGALVVLANPLAERRRRLLPQFAREVLGHHRHRTLVVDIRPREVAPGDERVAHRLQQSRRDELERADRRQLALLRSSGPRRRSDRASRGRSSARRDVRPTDVTPGIAAILSMIAWCIRTTASGSFTWASGMLRLQRQHVLRIGEARIDVAQRLERADHQSRADQQHQRQRHLHDDQRAARAVTLAARAGVAAAAAQRRGDVRSGVLEDRNRAEQQAGDDRDDEREQQDRRDRSRCCRAAAGCRAPAPAARGPPRRRDRARPRRRPDRGRCSRRAARRRCGRGWRRAPRGSPAPAAALRRAPAAGSRRWRRRSAAPCRSSPSAPTAPIRRRR